MAKHGADHLPLEVVVAAVLKSPPSPTPFRCITTTTFDSQSDSHTDGFGLSTLV